jgi:acyl-CoA synthetase (AMP-forming)/AMP-acid ligase II
MTSIFDQHLPRTAANFAPLSPLGFIERTAEVYPDRLAIVHGSLRQTWAQTYARCRQLASSLRRAGIGKNDTVAVMLPNTPPMVEAHFGVPMAGAVLNALNTRLDPEAIAFMLDHGEAKAVIVDPEFAPTMAKALALRQSTTPLLVIDVEDAVYGPASQTVGSTTYEAFVAGGDPRFAWELPADEWDAIALNYTSGTTGNPKGVVYHHRGAYTNAISNVLEWDMPKHAVYLWTLPMFHCNGWCFPWTVAARAGVNVCLRRVEAQAIFDAIRNHGVTHYCGAPIVHGLLVNAPEDMKAGVPAGVKAMVAGAAPPASMIEGMEKLGFDLTHVYGLTEVYGPATVCAKHEAWDDARHRRARAPERPPGRALPPGARRARARPRNHAARAPGRRDHGRDHVQGQHRHEGLPEEPPRPPKKPLPVAGSTAATWQCNTPTATSRSRTAARTSSSRAARTSRPSRWKTCFTATPTCWPPPWWPSPIRSGAKRPAPSSNSRSAPDHARGHRGALQEAPGRLQGAACRGVRRAAQDQHRQDPEVRAAQAWLTDGLKFGRALERILAAWTRIGHRFAQGGL